MPAEKPLKTLRTRRKKAMEVIAILRDLELEVWPGLHVKAPRGPRRVTPETHAEEVRRVGRRGPRWIRPPGTQLDPVALTGLQNDLMGSPGHGRVTEAMIDRILRAYLVAFCFVLSLSLGGLFFTMLLLFCRYLPMVAMTELRGVIADEQGQPSTAADKEMS